MVADWDGQGLPPIAAERARRAAAGGAWTSLLTAPAAAGLQVAGFEPVGEVMGSIVSQVGWTGYRGCGMYGGGFAGWDSTTVAAAGRLTGYGPYVDALNHGYQTAMSRMLEEAATIGADGVVGVGLKTDHLDSRAREFVALGTAVRARGSVRPRRPFSTHLPGQDVAKLVTAGWMPTDLVFGISVAIRHDDWRTQRQASWGAGNVEVAGYTELVELRPRRRPLAVRQARAGRRGRGCRRVVDGPAHLGDRARGEPSRPCRRGVDLRHLAGAVPQRGPRPDPLADLPSAALTTLETA